MTLMKIWLHDQADELKRFLYAVERNIPQLILNKVNDNIEIEVALQEVKKDLSENLFLKDSFIDLVVDGLAAAFGLINERKYQITENYLNVTEFEFTNGTINKYIGKLKEVNIPSVINEKVVAIGNDAFKNCSSLTQITIPSSVTSIGEWAFTSCSGLTQITIPNSVTSIRKAAFLNCSNLTQIAIPNSVTSIGDSAFCGCSSLTQITIPNSVISIGYWAFTGCSSLTHITITDSVTTIGNEAFSGCNILTIYAKKDSYAAKYANKNNIKVKYVY